MNSRLLFLFLGAWALAEAPPPTHCSIRNADGSGWRPSVDHARNVVRNADAIVRVRAAHLDSLRSRGVDRFVVLEILDGYDGDSVPPSLSVYGWLADTDDYNPRAVPYPAVRPAGLLGSCFAEEYRQGAEYLLLLKREDRQLTPYWAALAPTNEQIRGPDDPWVLWVLAERRRVRSGNR